ncbi:MAG: PrsW family glutamic-type intramembrane protease [Halobacteriota archaeon]
MPSHAIFSSTWGYALGLAKCTPKVQKGHIVVTGVLLAILLHGIFNFLALTGILFAFDMLIFVPLGWILVNSRIMRALSVPLELSTAPLADRQLRATPVFALIAVLSFIAAPCGERGADSK